MTIDGDTIVFRSRWEWYRLERGGEKPNTVRLIDQSEYDELCMTRCNKVRVECVDPCDISLDVNPREFTRRIVWAGKLDYVLGKVLYMVCWEH